MADGSFVDHLDPGLVERGDQLDQRIDIASDHRFAGLHALNGWHGKSRQFGESTLIDAEKHPRSPQLSRCDHRSAPESEPIQHRNLHSYPTTTIFRSSNTAPRTYFGDSSDPVRPRVR